MKLIFFIILIEASMNIQAQSLERFVINSSGSTQTAGSISLKSSVGEPLVGKVGDGALMFSQGFYTGSFVLYVSNKPLDNISATVYPNPFTDRIYIQGNLSEIKTIEIFNLTGVRVYAEEINQPSILLNKINDGIYIIKIIDKNYKTISSAKLIKTTL